MQLPIREFRTFVRERHREAIGASRVAVPPPANFWRKNIAIGAAAGFVLAVAGAMHTDQLAFWMRLAYWAPLMIAGVAIGCTLSGGMALLPRAASSRWLSGFALTAAVTLPVTAFGWAYAKLFAGAPNMAAPTLLEMLGVMFVISAAMIAIMMTVYSPGRATRGAPTIAHAPVRFLERLPAKLRGAELYAVSAEDHYLRVHTSKGSDLILMRLADAIAELDGLEGAQTHRSWWVAREAVQQVRRAGDRLMLTLKGGVEAPVSRPNIGPLRDEGWF